MKTFLGLILLIGSGIGAWAQADYQAGTIPQPLKENAHAVIRNHETTFTVKSPGQAVRRVHRVITVLDEQGDSYASLVAGYDKFSKINSFEGALYDAQGKQIKKLKNADVKDYSSYMDYNLFDDNRLKSATFPKQPAYPYTVEFTVETTERNLMFYPTWLPQYKEHLAVEQATFAVAMPPGLALRYKESNLPVSVTVTQAPDGGKAYNWKLTNLLAVEFEPLSPPAVGQLPVVYTAPAEFEVQDYQGKLLTWSDLGTFYYKLNDGRDRIPDDLRQRVAELTKTEATTIGKVRKLYRFLQEQTRYVSIQLGIGGWQTIEAEKVAATRYGDCKALTNYAMALLKTAGIPAYPALVNAGDDEPDVLTDFPSFQFNHVILCVPDGRDTLFLECTSHYNPVGYAGDFTGSRHALLVLPEGSRLIKTPAYQPANNLQQRHILLKLNEQGDATATVSTYYTGLQQDDYANAIHSMNHDDLRSWLLKRIHIPAFELNNFAYKEYTDGLIPAVTETLDLTVRRWATVSGTRLFLPLNLMSALAPATPMMQPRKTPVDLTAAYDFQDSDTITYQLPKGYKPEYQIEPVLVESAFGRYTTRLVVEGERATYIRNLTMHRGQFPATAYTSWVDFRRKIAKADHLQLVFVKSN